LNAARCDQHAEVWRQHAADRSQGKQRNPGDEDALRADPIAGRTRRQIPTTP
jgi:hypothetical protein